MEFKEYTDGKRTIKATVTMYEMLYRNAGFKPLETNSGSDKRRSNRNDKRENPTNSSVESTDE